jgi:hypothetical protein
MTEAEADALLKQLAAYFNQPVLPLQRFCGAIEQWMGAIEQASRENQALPEAERRHQQGESYWPHLRAMRIDIRKSALLGRLIYDGQKLRTKKCPLHQGRQHMHIHLGFEAQCPHECDGTGWLREEGDASPSPTGPFLVTVAPAKGGTEP